MNRILLLFLIAFFAVFLGSQITEGFLLVPYWKTLTKKAFYDYYLKFGPIISRFYTILTIIAVLIPLNISVYCFIKKSHALIYSVISSLFSILIIVVFYSYFKDVNQQLYQTNFDANQLKSELNTWEYMHWFRVLFEVISLLFLIISIHILNTKKNKKNA